MLAGTEVEAKGQIAEEQEDGTMLVHAEAGDVGQVVDVVLPGEWFMVAWANGTAQCHTDELSPLEAAP
jgi:hypothetical protein